MGIFIPVDDEHCIGYTLRMIVMLGKLVVY